MRDPFERQQTVILALTAVGVILAVAVVFGVQSCAAADINPPLQATCKVITSGGIRTAMGTGIAIQNNGTTIKVLTNAHNVIFGGVHATISTRWYRDGFESAAIPATLEWYSYERNTARDLAILSIPVRLFGRDIPCTIPLATRAPAPGEKILSVGNSRGAWSTAFVGHVKQPLGAVFSFVPPPAGGRSGSAIMSADGSCILGLITWRIGVGQNQEGRAISAAEIVSAFRGNLPGQITDTRSSRLSSHLCTLGTPACLM